jgi:hypothetical protein
MPRVEVVDQPGDPAPDLVAPVRQAVPVAEAISAVERGPAPDPVAPVHQAVPAAEAISAVERGPAGIPEREDRLCRVARVPMGPWARQYPMPNPNNENARKGSSSNSGKVK